MPAQVLVTLTVREDGSREGIPVIQLNLVDPAGETRAVHITEELGMELVGDLAVAVRQLHRGREKYRGL